MKRNRYNQYAFYGEIDIKTFFTKDSIISVEESATHDGCLVYKIGLLTIDLILWKRIFYMDKEK